ncbi:N-acylneuraminate cytidylyltransferase [Idiomarina fontislapidosi]|uniref:Pseudaminic acid cytidylyltransferase n=1 Tax=Idiomarina fontislapidosi TaxID=263723 RepID=A0A432XYZ4_9GAMM|nr:pseudaminic acid cytidylyltransferase [Idiomarina fontislapidosi]PYE32758.1 N-acylneuraminate cytidylyltransferase [Idiomarina fontislapidosi]RUO53801.1 pseudaminic acid cytidylyltransferase [Idiomarina fontislapidosi]
MKVAVIPARGGSKRIPGKNIKDFCGKPMIAWSIESAKSSKCFDRIIVSTDDTEIAEVARKYGAEVPFMRPESLSDDFTGTLAVIIHAIEMLENDCGEISEVCCLYATAPLITAEDINRGLETLKASGCEYAIGVSSFSYPIQRALLIDEQQKVKMVDPSAFSARSQDLKEAFHDAGQFYWGTRNAWMSGVPSFLADTAPVILPRYRVQDIDTTEDWYRAELLFRAMSSYGS